MTRTNKGILRLQVRELKKALYRGSVFVGYGRDARSGAKLEIQVGWRSFINRLASQHLKVRSPIIGNEAKVNSIWKLLEEAEAHLEMIS